MPQLTQRWFIAVEVQNKAHLSGVSVSLQSPALYSNSKTFGWDKVRVNKPVYYCQLWKITSSMMNPLFILSPTLHLLQYVLVLATKATVHASCCIYILVKSWLTVLTASSSSPDSSASTFLWNSCREERKNLNRNVLYSPKSVLLYSVDRSSLGDKCLTKHKAMIAWHQLGVDSF